MNINGAFPSSFLKAADLQNRRVAVVISHVTMEDIGSDTKPVLHFQGKDKGLVLNKTNANMIAEICGSEETDDWKGKRIVLYPTKTDFQGKRVDAIRIDYPGERPNAIRIDYPGERPAPAVTEELTADSIPF